MKNVTYQHIKIKKCENKQYTSNKMVNGSAAWQIRIN